MVAKGKGVVPVFTKPCITACWEKVGTENKDKAKHRNNVILGFSIKLAFSWKNDMNAKLIKLG
jgi:hypothetical protein